MSYNKYSCYRNFWVHDEEGKECVFVESTFVLMDQKNRKISSVLPEVIVPFDSEKITKIYRHERIEKITEGNFLPYRVRFFDIDGNQRASNAIYFNWLLDVLGYDFLTTHQPKKILVKFDKKIEYGQEVESYYRIAEQKNQLKTRHEVRADGQTYCEANIDWTN